MGPRSLAVLGPILLVVVAGCSVPAERLGLRGHLQVLGPEAGFDPDDPPAGWVRTAADGGGFAVAETAGVLALGVGGDGGDLLGRRVEVPLLAAPYLGWSWYLDPDEGAARQARPSGATLLRLFVAFRGGNPEGGGWSDRVADWLGLGLPPHDRALEIAWAAAPALPGTYDAAHPPPRFVANGGWREAGAWRHEALDLSALYRKFWPDDRIGEAAIVYIAAGAGPAAGAVTGHVAEVVLFR